MQSVRVLLGVLCVWLFTAGIALPQNRLFVVCTSPAAAKSISADAFSKLDAANRQAAPTLRVIGNSILVLDTFASASEWSERQGVEAVYVDPSVSPRTVVPNDPGFVAQWNLAQINMPAAWEITTGGTTATGHTIVIGVIESNGFDLFHPELQERYFTNVAELGGNRIDDDGNGFVDDVNGWNFVDAANDFRSSAHGVHVCATLGANTNNGVQTAGINWDASLLPLEVSTIGEWTLALDYLSQMRERWNASGGAQGAYVVAANMSLGRSDYGCDEFPPFAVALRRAAEAGIIPVGATGNDAGDVALRPDFPSTCTDDMLVMVTASSRSDELLLGSGFGSQFIDIAAPGEEYTSVDYLLFGRNQNTFNGTSAAAPHVTGVAALAFSIPDVSLDRVAAAAPEVAAQFVRQAMLSSAEQVPNLEGWISTNGRLDAAATLRELESNLAVLGQVLVQLEPARTAPAAVLADGVRFELERTLNATLGVQLYVSVDRSNVDDASLDALREALDAVVASRNVVVRSTLNDSDDGNGEEALAELDDALRTDRAKHLLADLPTASRALTTAVFATGFSAGSTTALSSRLSVLSDEIPGNSIDEDDSGYLDDVSGVDLTSRSAVLAVGSSGSDAARLVLGGDEELRGLDATGEILPLTGTTLADWIAGAEYVTRLRNQYNTSKGSRGLAIATYLSMVDATLTPEAMQLVRLASEGMASVGINSIASYPNDAAANTLSAALPQGGTLLIGNLDQASDNLGIADRLLQVRRSAAASPNNSRSAQQSALAAAYAAGLVTLAASQPCTADVTEFIEQPTLAAQRALGLVYASAQRPAGTQQRTLDLADGVRTIYAECLDAAQLQPQLLIYPNPSASAGTVTVETSALTAGNGTLQIIDPVGRVLQQTFINFAAGGYSSALLDVRDFAPGCYYIVIQDGAGTGFESKLMIGEY